MVRTEMDAQPMVSDGSLVTRTLRGDLQAREWLAHRVRSSSYVFAVQLTGRRDLSQDIAQDSVMRFFASLDRFDQTRSLDAWLFQIVRNRTRDVMRRNRIRLHEPLEDPTGRERPETRDERADPAADALRADLQRRIWRQLDSLTPQHREILVLREYQDLSYREIAEVLEIPHGTVMSRLHMARKRLRDKLADGEIDDPTDHGRPTA